PFPYTTLFRSKASEEQLLKMARMSALGVMVVGMLLVPVFMMFDSIYAAHGAFTAAVTPPMVVALLFAVFWKRFTAPAAIATLVGGTAAIVLSVLFPEIITPLAHGVPPGEAGDGLLGGAKQYKLMRALVGLLVSGVIGVTVTMFTRPEPIEKRRGLVWGTIRDAIRSYKGSPGTEHEGPWRDALPTELDADETFGEADIAATDVSRALADALKADVGDVLYVSDARSWLGGLRSGHVIIRHVTDDDGHRIALGPELYGVVEGDKRKGQSIRVKRLYGGSEEEAHA